MSSSYEAYFQYLTNRSRLGLLYRNYWLYPRICSHLTGRVLDVGCGIGDFLEFREQTVGADINPEAVNFCKKRGLDVVQMEVDRLPFSTGDFDGVLLDNVLEHIRSPGLLIEEIYRVLKSSGTLVIGVPGIKGFDKDPDHKLFYNEKFLVKTICEYPFVHRNSFYTPLKSDFLSARLPQYCLYSRFIRM